MKMRHEAVFSALCTLLLLWEALTDLRRQEISVGATLLLYLTGLARCLVLRISFSEIAFAALPGLLLLAMAFGNREGLGVGDALVISGLALWHSLLPLLAFLLAAFLSAACYGMILLLFKKRERGFAFPFLPFLIPAQLLGIGIFGAL